MIQINLIPDVKSEHIKAVRQKQLITTVALITSGVFLAVVILLSLTVFVVQKNRISSLSSDIEEKIGQLQSIEDLDKTLTIQNQLSAIPKLYNSKPNVGNLFQYLSILTPENEIFLKTTEVNFVTANANAESETIVSMNLSGSTATLKDVNRFADIIKNASFSAINKETGDRIEGLAFSSVVVDSVSKEVNSEASNESVTFTISMEYDSEIFNIKNDSIALSVPSIFSSVSSTEKPNFNPEPFQEEGSE